MPEFWITAMDLFDYQNLVLFVARLVLGVTFVLHGWPKIKNPMGMAEWLKSMRFPMPALLSVIVAVVEFFGGLAVLLGVYTQLPALLISFNMLIATLVRKIANKDKWVGGYELDLSLLALALLIALYGPGEWTL
ncbi:MAG: DoxX family protein [bacterium]|nr:DoxX family protein [bacterium]